MLERFSGPNNRQLVLRVTELVGPRGNSIGRTLLIADETRLRLLEENAQRAAHLAALGEMSAGIAHEIRNPLTSLRGCAQELAEMSCEDGHHDAESLAHILVSESDRLARIVEDFLSLSRLRPPCRMALELGPLVDEARRLCEARRDRPPGLRLDFVVVDDCDEVDADAGQLKQVLANLVNNALDALRQTSLPTLILHAENATDSPLSVPAVRITVRDNGCGIPEDIQERIFTPFFSTKSQGTGLGLSLVSRIIREHEGVLHLDSSPGQGTSIIIYLPAHSQTRVFKRALGGG
jgi:signal transduction histidine kinase